MRMPDRLVAGLWEPAWDLYEGSVRLRTFRELRRRQFDAPEALEARRRLRLNAVVRHAAANVPFWRERFAAAGIEPAAVRDIADLGGLPPLEKAEVRERGDEMIARDCDRSALVPAKTGGSTGEPLSVFCDRRGVQLRAGAALLADTWSGWRLGQPVAAVWGNPPEATTWRNRLRGLLKDRVVYLDTMRLDAAAVDAFVEGWRRLRPGLLYGHAHSLYLLAEMLGEGARGLQPSGIVATSMMLLQPEREVIERVFGTPVTNRYGCEEVSLIACECERHRGLHLNHEHAWVEVLRDDGVPCAPGEEGRIVVTEFVNRGMPLIRYAVGDRAVPAAAPCPCGRPSPLLAAVTGRTADFLRAADGSRVAGISLIERTLTLIPGLARLQLVQREPLRVRANVVPGPEYGERSEAALIAALREALGEGMAVDLRRVPAIVQDPSGKYRFAVCTLASEPAAGGKERR